MILCFDIGNTDIDTGVFENDVLIKTFNIPYEKSQPSRRYIPPIKKALEENGIDAVNVKGCVLCSVVDSTTKGVHNALVSILGFAPMLFKNDESCGLTVKTDNPAEVGTDILASCLAVKKKYSLPAVIIDMGTASTVTAMDKDGAVLGVSIITGVITTLKALNSSTGLPVDYELVPPSHAIGTNTADSIASGAVFGSAYIMDGMIKSFEKEMGEKCHIYATGGISKVIMPLCERECEINSELLLEGLYLYYKAKKEK